ncbi:hypothetical protein [Paenibacillus tepidiphilus]|uniref:hypothetical protein n=1 Tax=Paenibacillus tepidiphilus TaxID=2608683 RepID=UPI001239C70D|nr:hypothetical protein [Paenibacillus tepidiphilus]
MNTSSFLCGVVLGAVASTMISRKRGSMMSALLSPNGAGQGAGEKAKDKILGMAGTGFGSTATGSSGSHSTTASAETEHKSESTLQSKESNLRMLKDFIRSNPDVKHEVEKILKETHTTIPGL